MYKNKTILFAMPNSHKLGSKVSKNLGIKLSPLKKTTFSDGEVILQSKIVVRNKDVFIVAATAPPVNENLVELLIFIDSLKRASAKSINIILTYYGYARQERKVDGRQPITAKLVANLLQVAGVDKITTIDIHNKTIQGFFDIPSDDLYGSYLFAPVLSRMGSFTVVSPDHGGTVRARELANLLTKNTSSPKIAVIDKRRTQPNVAETFGILGTVKNRNCVILDDMIDTGGTIIKAAKALKEEGAKKIIVAASHGLFTKGFEQFEKSKHIDLVMVTDSIESVHNIKSKKLRVVSLQYFITGIVKAAMNSTSVSQVYKQMVARIHKK